MKAKIILLVISLFFLVPTVMAINATNYTYNLIPSSEENDLYGFVVTVNNMTTVEGFGPIFMPGILMVIFVIFFVALLRFGTSDALLASGFITSVFTVLFAALNFVSTLVTVLILLAYGGFFSYRMVIR